MATEECCGNCSHFVIIRIPENSFPDEEATGMCTLEAERIITTSDSWCGDHE